MFRHFVVSSFSRIAPHSNSSPTSGTIPLLRPHRQRDIRYSELKRTPPLPLSPTSHLWLFPPTPVLKVSNVTLMVEENCLIFLRQWNHLPDPQTAPFLSFLYKVSPFFTTDPRDPTWLRSLLFHPQDLSSVLHVLSLSMRHRCKESPSLVPWFSTFPPFLLVTLEIEDTAYSFFFFLLRFCWLLWFFICVFPPISFSFRFAVPRLFCPSVRMFALFSFL